MVIHETNQARKKLQYVRATFSALTIDLNLILVTLAIGFSDGSDVG